MKIFYGILENKIDVTNICFGTLMNDNIITIPCYDNERAELFSDPVFNVKKKIFVLLKNQMTEYESGTVIKINIIDKQISAITNSYVDKRLEEIHNRLKIVHGTFTDEVPEQKMVARYLTGTEKVLEIGANVGRNSLIIAEILKKETDNFVTLECDPVSANLLLENRDANNFTFKIEVSALSKRKLIQKYWDTIESDVLLDGYSHINTITLDELREKYKIDFDTLVLDCEGAFYFILMDMPSILDNINLIIMENDYHEMSKKKYIDDVLKQNNFVRHYSESGGWGPCYTNFFEVWKRNVTCPKKITKHISFYYSPSRICFLNSIIDETNNYKYTTDIFIHTNNSEFCVECLTKYSNGSIHVVHHDLTDEHPHLLTWKCRDLLYKQKSDYDIFMYIEDDILVPRTAIDYWLRYNESLIQMNYNLGFVRIEVNDEGVEFITDIQDELYSKVIEISGEEYVLNDVNPYCAFWIYNKKEFNIFTNSKYYDISNIKVGGCYGMRYAKEASAFGLHSLETPWYSGTVIPFVEMGLDPQCKIYHMANNYVSNSGTNFAKTKFTEAVKLEYKLEKLDNFVGTQYRLADNWFSYVNVKNYNNRPIKYLEIGTFFGANIISVAKTYGAHANTELYCIDPWEDYNDYPEYKNMQSTIYDTFLLNIENSGQKEKIKINRGYSNIELPKFQDDFFHIIYIDGNHEPEYVLEDAVLSFRKLKTGGIMIFDDYGWGGPDLTKRGIDGFLNGYHKKIHFIGEKNSQIFILKL